MVVDGRLGVSRELGTMDGALHVHAGAELPIHHLHGRLLADYLRAHVRCHRHARRHEGHDEEKCNASEQCGEGASHRVWKGNGGP